MTSENKVGVYLCSGCGLNESINFDELVKVAAEENKIPVCKVSHWLCSEENIEKMKSEIKAENLDRVVVGACSQRFLTDVFNFGRNVFIDRVNLRENVAWTHKPNDEDTQMLANDYLRMGIAKVNNCEIPEPFEKDINETILVVGGGITGLTAALAASKSGSSVVLVEKSDKLGGWLNNIYKTEPMHYPYTEPEIPEKEKLISEVERNESIKIYTSCSIRRISGEPGNFSVTLSNPAGESITVGSIIQATGSLAYNADKLDAYGYGKSDNIMTGVQFEEYFTNGKKLLNGEPVKSVAFIQCAGSRDKMYLPYCSSTCCATSLKQALYVREKYPDALVYVIYKDIRTPANLEYFYKRVQEEDNIFFTKGDVVNVEKTVDDSISIDIDNTLLGDKIRIKSDVVVLATGTIPSTLVGQPESGEDTESNGNTLDGKKAAQSAEAGARILNLSYRQGTDLPTLKYGYPDSHYICFPYETRRTGIYAAGSVRYPMDLESCKEDSFGAALKAIQVIHNAKKGKAVHPRSGDQSYPDFFLQRCTQCKRCTEECPFGTLDEDAKGTPLPNLARCRRCGICLGACPERIISFQDYSIQMISSMIKAVDIPDEFEEKPRILAFLCENDAYPSLDLAGRHRLQYNPNIRVIPVRCLGSVNVVWIADALSRGFDGVLMIGCKYGDDYQCHFIKGSELASKRMENVQEKLKQLVLEPERVKLVTLSLDEYKQIPEIFNSFVEEIAEIGFNPYKGM